MLDEDEESGTFHHTVFLLDGGQLFGLHTHMGAESGDAFDERRTGLDHVGFALSGTAELEQWRDRLDELGIAHGGIKKAGYGTGLSFRDSDNIALEFFIAPVPDTAASAGTGGRSRARPVDGQAVTRWLPALRALLRRATSASIGSSTSSVTPRSSGSSGSSMANSESTSTAAMKYPGLPATRQAITSRSPARWTKTCRCGLRRTSR